MLPGGRFVATVSIFRVLKEGFLQMNIFKIMALVLAGVVFSGNASAQNSQLSATAAVFDSATSQWVAALFNEGGFSAAIIEQSAAFDQIEVTAPSGGVFYVAVRACDESTPKRCGMLQPYALFDATGVTLSDLNAMLRDNFAVSYAYLQPDNHGTIASKITLSGGVTKGNVIQELAAYFYDLDNLIAAISPGTRAEVNFAPADGLSRAGVPKIDNTLMGNDDLVVNAVGLNAPKFMTEALKALAD